MRHDQHGRKTSLLLKIPEAAQLLSIGRSTVYELFADGHLETVHFGRAVRVTTASIEAFVDRERSVQHPINERTAIQRR